MSISEIVNFMNGELVHWVESCLPNGSMITDYASLRDGAILHSVYLQIDPTARQNLPDASGSSRTQRSFRNFSAIVKNLTNLYAEEFAQTVLYSPDCSVLAESPDSRKGLEQMKLLITLLLGAAVQCCNKEIFIARIKSLDEDIQHSIVQVIRKVTEGQSLVLNQAAIEQLSKDATGKHVVRLVEERNHYRNMWMLSEESASDAVSNTDEVRRLTGLVAEYKNHLEKLRQEGDETAERFRKLKIEHEYKSKQYEELSVKSQDWFSEARRAAVYRDEVDALRERAERADHAVKELQALRPKLDKLDILRNRVKQLEEDKKGLEETKKIVEAQLERSQQRNMQLPEMEAEIARYRHEIIDMSKEQDAAKHKIQELLEENAALQMAVKGSRAQMESVEYLPSTRNSLSEQITNQIKSKNIKLELENRRLLAAFESLQEASNKVSTKDQQTELQLEALKMDNSHLASNRDSLKKQLDIGKQDYKTLKRVHVQLNDDCTALKRNIEELKVYNRSLEDHIQKQRKEMSSVENNFATLAVEHSELKSDFQKLHEDREQLKEANNSLMRQMVELEVDIKGKVEHSTTLEMELTSVHQRCEMLYKMNSSLDGEKRTQMELYSKLMNQYHQLLEHSLEDKRHFHDNEKMNIEKINELQRQKEKLEEKIMDYYGKMENCSPNKKKNVLSAFTFRNLRKAASGLKKGTPEKEKPIPSSSSVLQSDPEEHTTSPDSRSNESDDASSSEEVFINQLAEQEDEYVSLRNQGVRRSLLADRRPKPVQTGVRYSLPG